MVWDCRSEAKAAQRGIAKLEIGGHQTHGSDVRWIHNVSFTHTHTHIATSEKSYINLTNSLQRVQLLLFAALFLFLLFFSMQ